MLHPRVGHQNPPGRDGGTQSSQPRRGQMEALANLVPSEEHHGHKGGFHKERHDALYGQRSSEDVAHQIAVVAPVGTELKLQDDARSDAHSKVNAKETLPELGCLFPELAACAVVLRLHNTHYHGQAECQGYEQPMVNGCQGELRSCPVHHRHVNV